MVKASDVEVDLHLVEHVDVRLAGKFRGGNFIKGPVDVLPRLVAKETHLPRDATILQQLAQCLVIPLLAVVLIVAHQLQTRPLDDLQRRVDQRSHDLNIGGLHPGSLRRHIVHIRDAILRHCHMIHRQTQQVADTTSDGAVQHEQVLHPLQFRRHGSPHHLLELLSPQENRDIVHHMHNNTPLLYRNSSERGAAYFVGILKLCKECLQQLQVVDHSGYS